MHSTRSELRVSSVPGSGRTPFAAAPGLLRPFTGWPFKCILECRLTNVAAVGGVVERAEALASLVSTARFCLIHRSRTSSVRRPIPGKVLNVALRILLFASAALPPAALGWWLGRQQLHARWPRLTAVIVVFLTMGWAFVWVVLNMRAAGSYTPHEPSDPADAPAMLAFSLLVVAVLVVVPFGIYVAYRAIGRAERIA